MKVTVSWFSVKDFEQAKKFYGESLGLKKTLRRSNGRSLQEAKARHPSAWP